MLSKLWININPCQKEKHKMKELYESLMKLQIPNDYSKFYFKDFVSQAGTNCRVFSYHFASYTDWLNENALESRGIMFEMDANNEQPIRIMSRPMEKFFNLNETPFTMNLDYSQIIHMLTKEDGSLISSFEDKGNLFTKSKTSLFSTQAIESKQILLDYNYKDLHDRCLELALDGYTCNFEYVSPHNRVVLAYESRDLILLNVRHNETGEYILHEDLVKDPVLRKYLVEVHYPSEVVTEETIEEIRNMVDIEGFIFQMRDGLKFKLKTEWYSTLHRMKDTLKNNEALFEVVVAGGSDDIKSLYSDTWSKTKIEKFEIAFLAYLKSASTTVFEMHKSLAGSDRKTYAVACQTRLKDSNQLELFGVLMKMFDGFIIEDIMSCINIVFLKNCKRFVPEEYI